MNNQKNSITSYIILGVVVLIAVIAYLYIKGGKPPISETIMSVNTTDPIGQETLALLNQVSTLNIDTTFFDSAAYKTLRDFTVEIPAQDVGRPNPFAPVPGMNLKANAQGAVTR